MVGVTNTLFNLDGKTAIVTGASRGIGEAIARRLAQHGANVVVSSRKPGACKQVADTINETEGREAAHVIGCNISHKEELQHLVDETKAKWGPADILVSNAAVNPYFGPSSGMSDEQFDKILSCNVKASHWLSHMVLPDMQKKKDGAIIIISSIGGFVGSPAIGAYNISKAADLQLARNLAVEYGPDNIRVNCICPGVVKTYFAEALWKDPKVEKMMTEKLPMRRFGEPDDVAGAAVFLASPAAQWMTGQSIIIDGGTLVGLGGL
ncbi:SDR family oxidoreductase [Hyphococcus flavus]|uniref:SDR family oxidoreductase n=1 Tax=Hyphococcus flavus TaxID=1866326 RepID=A0AAE9ZHV5_9PROT|nr:SDR family oxidoreductase [Hyphococcus flavus]WDI30510.1 SDR family oxidoreductase [Hyphococcus flavus]